MRVVDWRAEGQRLARALRLARMSRWPDAWDFFARDALARWERACAEDGKAVADQ